MSTHSLDVQHAPVALRDVWVITHTIPGRPDVVLDTPRLVMSVMFRRPEFVALKSQEKPRELMTSISERSQDLLTGDGDRTWMWEIRPVT